MPSFEQLLDTYRDRVITRAEGCTDNQRAEASIRAAREELSGKHYALKLAFITLLVDVKTMAQQLPINTGTCCCGSPMADHDPFDNHSPRDEGEYFITSAIKAAEEALDQ
jgi:hypothetical protein